jgi:DNA-binding XRE family transcriptional regulator
MKASKRKRLEAVGWKVGSASDFLELTEAEEALIAMKLALAKNLQERRKKRKLTQVELGKRIGSSQSRVAKMEVADKSVSVDLLIRSLLSLGASRKEIGTVVAARVVNRQVARPARKKLAKS